MDDVTINNLFTAANSLLSEHLKGNAWELDDF